METRMITFNLCLLLLLYFSPFTSASQDEPRFKYYKENNALNMPGRIIILMQEHYTDAAQRHTDLNVMRFMYEESPQYETGYITSEIIERYRKMVMHLKRAIFHNGTDTAFDTLKRVEVIQKLYFEVYHLCNMNNEIRRKWRYMPEFVSLDDAPLDPKAFNADRDKAKYDAKRKAEEKKRHDNFMKRLQDLIDNMKNKERKDKAYNKWWPLDYGWEINYYW